MSCVMKQNRVKTATAKRMIGTALCIPVREEYCADAFFLSVIYL